MIVVNPVSGIPSHNTRWEKKKTCSCWRNLIQIIGRRTVWAWSPHQPHCARERRGGFGWGTFAGGNGDEPAASLVIAGAEWAESDWDGEKRRDLVPKQIESSRRAGEWWFQAGRRCRRRVWTVESKGRGDFLWGERLGRRFYFFPGRDFILLLQCKVQVYPREFSWRNLEFFFPKKWVMEIDTRRFKVLCLDSE